jgi:hypothetical protein
MNCTTAAEYVKSNRKEIELPSGAVFVIKKLTPRDYMKLHTANFPIINTEQINDKNTDEKAKEQWLKMTPDQQRASIEFNEQFVIAGTVSPKISKEASDNTLCIDDIDGDDFNALIVAISEFSTAKRQDLKSFRAEPKAVDAGHDSEAVQGAPVADIGAEQPVA